MPLNLTDIERGDIARIAHNSAPGTTHETIAKHFIAVGLERAAVRCDDLAAITRDGLKPSANEGEIDLNEAVAKAFEIAATAIRADK
jgi:hypothetical protein